MLEALVRSVEYLNDVMTVNNTAKAANELIKQGKENISSRKTVGSSSDRIPQPLKKLGRGISATIEKTTSFLSHPTLNKTLEIGIPAVLLATAATGGIALPAVALGAGITSVGYNTYKDARNITKLKHQDQERKYLQDNDAANSILNKKFSQNPELKDYLNKNKDEIGLTLGIKPIIKPERKTSLIKVGKELLKEKSGAF